MIKDVPLDVAKDIAFGLHPVVAWRRYYSVSKEQLAKFLGCSVAVVTKIEHSNIHLNRIVCRKLALAFGIFPEVLNLRFSQWTNINSDLLKEIKLWGK